MLALNTMRISTVLVIAGLAAGCSTPTWTSPAGTQAYQVGYKEGCDSGFAVAGSPMYERIDEASPPFDDEQYVLGWSEGFHSCRVKYNRIQNTIHSILGT